MAACGGKTESEGGGSEKQVVNIINWVMPGFIDSYVHTLYGALQFDSISLDETKTEEDAAKTVYEFYKDRDDKWVFGFQWAHYFWDKKALPTKRSLDKLLTHSSSKKMKLRF